MTMDLADLIGELERATRGSRELDLAILQTVTGKPWRWAHYGQHEGVTWDEYGPGAIGNPVCSLESHTSSVDSAMTLVPAGYRWKIYQLGDAHGRPIQSYSAWAEHGWRLPEDNFVSDMPTAPLALCIAALKARQSEKDSIFSAPRPTGRLIEEGE